jgi:hypothetical protein
MTEITHKGLEAHRWQKAREAKANPLHGTDFSKPISVLVQDIRTDMASLRDRLQDIARADLLHGDLARSAEGLMSCGIVTLSSLIKDLKAFERHAHETGPSPTDPIVTGFEKSS